MGLSQNKWKISIDGQEFGDFNLYADYDPETIMAYAHSNPTNYYYYIDDFGFSWDPSYELGDNLNEGHFLNYSCSTTLNWVGYSLDGNTNITISGNTTIPMPNDGHHTLQVFGIESSGPIHESKISYFSVGDIIIGSPENKTYLGMKEYYHPGTYNFKDDALGSDPVGWTEDNYGSSSGHDARSRIISSFEGPCFQLPLNGCFPRPIKIELGSAT